MADYTGDIESVEFTEYLPPEDASEPIEMGLKEAE